VRDELARLDDEATIPCGAEIGQVVVGGHDDVSVDGGVLGEGEHGGVLEKLPERRRGPLAIFSAPQDPSGAAGCAVLPGHRVVGAEGEADPAGGEDTASCGSTHLRAGEGLCTVRCLDLPALRSESSEWP
jgi:hypothetical protein